MKTTTLDRGNPCPLCGSILDEGHLTAGGYRITWTRKARRFSNMVDAGDVKIEPHSLTGALHNTALRCRGCGMIFLSEYGEE